MYGYLFFFLILLFAMKAIDKNIPKKPEKKKSFNYEARRKSNFSTETYTNYSSYANSYQKRQLLTNREQAAYYELRKLADQKGLLICPKIRLLDLVEPKGDASNQQALINKVWSKHVDFVICNQSMHVVCIIELDDTTHLRQDRMERDQFVDEVLQGAGYRIIHTWSITPDIFNFMEVHIERNGPTFEEWKARRNEEKEVQ